MFNNSIYEFVNKVGLIIIVWEDTIDIPYQLRTRSYNMTLINKTKFINADDYLIRMLYKYSY